MNSQQRVKGVTDDKKKKKDNKSSHQLGYIEWSSSCSQTSNNTTSSFNRLCIILPSLPDEEIHFTRSAYSKKFPDYKPQAGDAVQFILRDGFNQETKEHEYYARGMKPLFEENQVIGICDAWNSVRRFGFVTVEDFDGKIRVNSSDIWGADFMLRKGDQVHFVPVLHKKMKKYIAKNVRLIGSGPVPTSSYVSFSSSSSTSSSTRSSRSNSIASIYSDTSYSSSARMSVSSFSTTSSSSTSKTSLPTSSNVRYQPNYSTSSTSSTSSTHRHYDIQGICTRYVEKKGKRFGFLKCFVSRHGGSKCKSLRHDVYFNDESEYLISEGHHVKFTLVCRTSTKSNGKTTIVSCHAQNLVRDYENDLRGFKSEISQMERDIDRNDFLAQTQSDMREEKRFLKISKDLKRKVRKKRSYLRRCEEEFAVYGSFF